MLDRALQHGGRKRVVDEQWHVARGVGDLAQVDEFERRVRGRLDDDESRVGADRTADLRESAHVTSVPSSPLASTWSVPP